MKNVHGWYLPDDDVHFTQYLEGLAKAGEPVEYQRAQREAAMSHCDNFQHAIDIGAHIGLWAGPLCKRFNKVTAFEPCLDFEPFRIHNAPDAVWHNDALSDHQGYAKLVVNKENSGIAYVEECQHREDGCFQMTTLDAFNFMCVDFIKIDCEGYELPILKGATKTINKFEPVIVVEQKPKKSETYGWSQHSAVEYLIESHNYRIIDRVIDDWILKPAPRGGK